MSHKTESAAEAPYSMIVLLKVVGNALKLFFVEHDPPEEMVGFELLPHLPVGFYLSVEFVTRHGRAIASKRDVIRGIE